jgi:hypothetical protein
MAGTLSDAFKEHFAQANPEPVVQVALSLSVPDHFPVYFHNGHNGVDSSVDGDPNLVSITNVANSLDPVTRTNQISSIQFEIIDDGFIRSLVSTRAFYNAYCYISLGAPELAISDYCPVFFGRISRTWVEEGSLLFEVTDYEDLVFNQANFRTYLNKHPLEVLLQSMQDAGVPAARIDSSSFAFDAVSTTSHLCFSSYTGKIYGDPETTVYSLSSQYLKNGDDIYLNGLHSSLPTGTISDNDAYMQSLTLLLVRTDRYLREYLELTRSVLKADVFNNKLKMSKTLKTASVSKHFTVDEYADFQVEPNPVIFNKVIVKVGVGDTGIVLRFKDATSITSYGEHEYETSTAYFSAASEVTEEDYSAYVSSSFASLPLQSVGVAGFSGTRNLKEGTQVAADKIDSDNKFYGLFLNGIMEGTSNTTQPSTGQSHYLWAFDETGAEDTMQLALGKIQLNGLSHIGSTSSPNDNEGYLYHDITAVHMFADELLDRFSNTAPRIKFMTGLENINLELGDLISVDNDWFLSSELSLDGLDSNVKFEIVKKEVNLLGDNIGVLYECVYITKSSPPSTSISMIPPLDVILKPLKKRVFLKNSFEMAAENVVNNGLELAATSGLGFSIGAGKAISGGSGTSLQAAQSFTATANKHTYVGIDSNSGCITVKEVATSADEPALSPGEIRLGKIVSGASSVSSVVDLRSFGAITPRQLDRETIPPGENLIWNGGFEDWKNPGKVPNGWTEGADGKVLTDTFRDSDVVHSGRFSLKMDATSNSTQFFTDYIKVEHSSPYRVSLWARNAGAVNMRADVFWYTASKASASSSSSSVTNAACSAINTWEQRTAIVTPGSDVAYARIRITRPVSPTYKIYWDDIELRKEAPSFKATGAATTSLTVKALNKVECNTEVHDYGSNYDNSSNYRFTAPEAGVYQFEAAAYLIVVGSFSYIFGTIKKNGSTELSRLYGYQPATNVATVAPTTGPVELAKGDYVEFFVHPEVQTSATLSATAAFTWFSGRKIKAG